MSQDTRAQLVTLLNSKVLSGGNQTTAQNLRDTFNAIITSMINILDDKDQNGGYLGINSSGIVDVTKIAKVTPTGQFLRDDGSWQTVAAATYTASNGITLTASNFTNDLITGKTGGQAIIGGTAVGDVLTMRGTSGNGTSTVAALQFLVGNNGATTAGKIYNSGVWNIGNAADTTQRTLRIGEGTSYMDFGEIVGTFGGIWFQTLNPSTTNYTFGGDGSYAVINAPSLSVLFRSAGTTWATGTSALSSVSGGQFALAQLTSLANTANSSVQKFISYGAITQWSSGTTAVQYENNFTSPTYSGVAATTLTISATVVSDFAIASTNMSIGTNAAFYNPTRVLTSATTTGYGGLFNAPSGATTNWAIGAIGAVTSTIGYGVGATPSSTNFINASATVAGRYGILITNSSGGVSAQSSIRFGNNSQQSTIGQASTGATVGNGLYASALNFTQDDNGGFAFSQAASPSSGAWTRFRVWGIGNYTGQTTSTAISGFIWSSFSRTWANGGGATTIATQIENDWQTITYATSGGGTLAFTNIYGNYFNAPTLSGVTASYNYAAGFVGSIAAQGRIFITDTIGSAPLGYDLEINKTVNGGVEGWVRNTNAGTAAFAQFAARTNSTQQMKMGVLSSGYTTAGLFIPSGAFLLTVAAESLIIGHQTTAKPIYFVNNGTATTDVALQISATKSIICGNAALATNATDGFLYVPTCAGTPTGVPTTVTGRVPIVADSTNNKLYIYSGGAWVALN